MSLGSGAEDKGRPDIIAFFMRKLDERDARVMHLEARLDALEAQLVVERKRPRSDSSGSCDASASARGKRRRRYAKSNGESDEEGGHLAVLSAADSSDGSRSPLLSLPTILWVTLEPFSRAMPSPSSSVAPRTSHRRSTRLCGGKQPKSSASRRP